jgi:hypothetical protein
MSPAKNKLVVGSELLVVGGVGELAGPIAFFGFKTNTTATASNMAKTLKIGLAYFDIFYRASIPEFRSLGKFWRNIRDL